MVRVRRGCGVVAALACSLLLAAPAFAAASSWSLSGAPIEPGPYATPEGVPSFVFAGPSRPRLLLGVGAFRFRPPGPLEQAPGSTTPVQTAVADRAGRAVYALQDVRGAAAFGYGSSDGYAGRVQRIPSSNGRRSRITQLVGNGAGSAAALVEWGDNALPGRPTTLAVYTRTPGRAFRRRFTLPPNAVAGISIAPAGNVLAAWRQDDGVLARAVGRDGMPRRSVRLATLSTSSWVPAVTPAVGRGGRAEVAWVVKTESGIEARWSLFAAAATRELRFGRPRRLDRGPAPIDVGPLHIRLRGAIADMVLVMAGSVRVNTVSGTRLLRAPQTVTGLSSTAIAVAFGPRGAILIAAGGLGAREGDVGIFARLRPSGDDPFGGQEPAISYYPDRILGLKGLAAAFDPAGRTALIAADMYSLACGTSCSVERLYLATRPVG